MHLFWELMQFATSQISRTPTPTRYISATHDKYRGVASKMARGDAVARKNSHPSFALTKRHLWEARWKVFPSFQGGCSLFFLCFAIVFVGVLGCFRNPREPGYSIIRRQEFRSLPFFSFRAISVYLYPVLQSWHKGVDNMNFSRHRRHAYRFALHSLVRFCFWIMPWNCSVVTFYFYYYLLLDVLYGNIFYTSSPDILTHLR